MTSTSLPTTSPLQRSVSAADAPWAEGMDDADAEATAWRAIKAWRSTMGGNPPAGKGACVT